MSESGQVGQLLAQAREAQKLSLQQVANELKLSVSFVKAIEAEQCSSLPDVAFVRGYVRNYARLLGLPKEQTQQVVAHFETIMAPAKELTQGAPVVAPKTQGPRWWRLLWLLAVVLIVVQVYLMWQNSNTPTSEPKTELPKAETVAPVTKDATIDDSLPVLPSEAEEAEPAAEPLQEQAPVNSAEETESTAADNAVDAAPEAGLVLEFADECWVSVADRSGRTLFSGIKQAGEVLTLDGQAPYQFVFGNGAALKSMHIDGEVIALPDRRAGQVWRYSSQS